MRQPAGPPPASAAVRAAAVASGALLLLWPALWNGYPLLFSDTGAFLAQTVGDWFPFDKPLVYGPFLHLLHWRLSLWGPAVAQCLLVSHLLWLVQRAVGQGRPGRHLLLCAGLAVLTAAPWVATLLMPDIFAPVAVLCGFLLGFAANRLAGWERWYVAGLGTLAIAAHLSHLVVAAAVVAAVLLLRPRLRPVLRAAAPLAAAMAVLLATNLHMHGRFGLSPYGAVFYAARLIADGPGARAVEALCPGTGWHLCGWAGRLPMDSDAFLWDPAGPVWANPDGSRIASGPIQLAPEAGALIRATLWREPLAVAGDALRNTAQQLAQARVGDVLPAEALGAGLQATLATHFPALEARAYAAGRQARDELPWAARPFLWPHLPVLALGAALTALAAWRAWRARSRRRLGLCACVLAGLLANAFATGALSGPHDRYGARIAWLLPLAGLLALRPMRPGPPVEYEDPPASAAPEPPRLRLVKS